MYLSRIAITVLVVASTALAQNPAPRAPRGRFIVVNTQGKRGYLGVGVIELSGDRARALKLNDDSGVEVTSVTRNSPAAAAGLKDGDVILEVNGRKVVEVEEFIRTIGESDPGSKVTLSVWREGAKHSLAATLQARPLQPLMVLPETPALPNVPWPPVFSGETPRIGFEGETLSEQLAAFFGVKDGVLVRSVTAKTPADKAGLKAGDVVLKVNGTPVTTPREIAALVRADHRSFTFTVMRNHRELVLNVEVAGALFAPASGREAL